MEDFGIFMRRIRKEKNLSLQVLAERIDVGVAFLSLLENGKKQIPLDYGDKLSEVLELSDLQRMNLKNCIDYSNNKVLISMEEFSEKQKQLSVSFARKINEISNENIEKILDILDDEE